MGQNTSTQKIKMLPAALVAVATGIIINQLFTSSGSSLAITTDHLVKLPVPKSAEDFKALITFPNFTGFAMPAVWVTGITIAIVASIETLLCIEASDGMDYKKNYRYQSGASRTGNWQPYQFFYRRITYDIGSCKKLC